MPRKERIEYAGAAYHIISRGNYRKELFLSGKAGESFEKAIFEAVDRCGWELYAYVIMSNHYHLAIRTPEPNLVAGMKWLQSTFATRFNRWLGERGHVFQGRYKSILLSEDRPLLGLIDYIHLNPVRARLCTLEGLGGYALGSYAQYWREPVRGGLQREKLLSLCGLPDTLDGMQAYANRLKQVDARKPSQREILAKQYCRGWFLGSDEAKSRLVNELSHGHGQVDWEGVDLKELNRARWAQIVLDELEACGKSEADLLSSAKGADWKVAIAARLRRETTASNPWIAERLQMGHPNYVSNLVASCR